MMNTLRNKATLAKKSSIKKGLRSLAFLGTLAGMSLLVISGCGDDSAADTNAGANTGANTGNSDAPNLVALLTIDNATTTQNQAATLSLEVQNAGTAASGGTTVTFYRSTDETITAADSVLAKRTIPSVASKAKSDKLTFRVPTATVGTFYYGACVGVLAQETDKTDNCAAATLSVIMAVPGDTAETALPIPVGAAVATTTPSFTLPANGIAYFSFPVTDEDFTNSPWVCLEVSIIDHTAAEDMQAEILGPLRVTRTSTRRSNIIITLQDKFPTRSGANVTGTYYVKITNVKTTAPVNYTLSIIKFPNPPGSPGCPL